MYCYYLQMGLQQHSFAARIQLGAMVRPVGSVLLLDVASYLRVYVDMHSLQRIRAPLIHRTVGVCH